MPALEYPLYVHTCHARKPHRLYEPSIAKPSIAQSLASLASSDPTVGTALLLTDDRRGGAGAGTVEAALGGPPVPDGTVGTPEETAGGAGEPEASLASSAFNASALDITISFVYTVSRAQSPTSTGFEKRDRTRATQTPKLTSVVPLPLSPDPVLVTRYILQVHPMLGPTLL